jgi:hypothetical protein
MPDTDRYSVVSDDQWHMVIDTFDGVRVVSKTRQLGDAWKQAMELSAAYRRARSILVGSPSA